jgi:hypothetical protein
VEKFLNLRFAGTDCALMTSLSQAGGQFQGDYSKVGVPDRAYWLSWELSQQLYACTVYRTKRMRGRKEGAGGADISPPSPPHKGVRGELLP